MALTIHERSKIDDIASPEAQLAWIESAAANDRSPKREFPQIGGDQHEDRVQLLRRDDAEWRAYASFLRLYVENALFEPYETVGRWWNLTIDQKGEWVRINVWRQYTLVVGFRAGSDGQQVTGSGFAYIDAHYLPASAGSRESIEVGFEVGEATYNGKPLVGNTVKQKAIHFKNVPLDNLVSFFGSPWMLRSTRSLNLDLMRGGKLQMMGSRSHVPKLFDAIFAENFTISERSEPVSIEVLPTSQSDEAPLPPHEEAEYQRLAWLRKNHTRYSLAVKAEGRCAVTGVVSRDLLEACHIKPFAESTDHEKLDPANGLCLAAHVHAAFDANLIGINPEGEVLFSDRLSTEDRRRLNLSEGARISVKDTQRPYLGYKWRKFIEKLA